MNQHGGHCMYLIFLTTNLSFLLLHKYFHMEKKYIYITFNVYLINIPNNKITKYVISVRQKCRKVLQYE